MHPDLLIGRMERPRCAPPGWRRSRHGRRRLAFRLSEVTDSPHLPSRHVAFSKQQERCGGRGGGPVGVRKHKVLVMINLKSGCLVGNWRVRVWVCVRSSDRLFLKPAEPLWNIDWAWLWCRTVKAPLMWANMWTRSDLEGFSLSSCSECTPALWADVHDNASVCPFLVLSKEFNGKVYSLSILFCFLCVSLSAFPVLKITGECVLVAAC